MFAGLKSKRHRSLCARHTLPLHISVSRYDRMRANVLGTAWPYLSSWSCAGAQHREHSRVKHMDTHDEPLYCRVRGSP